MVMLDLGEIAVRLGGTTPGPWRARTWGLVSLWGPECLIYRVYRDPEVGDDTWQRQQADARFIAAARSDVPALIAEVRHLRETVRRFENRRGCWCWVSQEGSHEPRCQAAREVLGIEEDEE